MRFQPKGVSLFDHTSDASEEPLPPGYVFAYSNINEIFGDWSPYSIGWQRRTKTTEVVTFEGRNEYQPGDYEGVAVIDEKGPFIIEGAHRFVALHYLNVKEFPAVVVVGSDR